MNGVEPLSSSPKIYSSKALSLAAFSSAVPVILDVSIVKLQVVLVTSEPDSPTVNVTGLQVISYEKVLASGESLTVA